MLCGMNGLKRRQSDSGHLITAITSSIDNRAYHSIFYASRMAQTCDTPCMHSGGYYLGHLMLNTTAGQLSNHHMKSLTFDGVQELVTSSIHTHPLFCGKYTEQLTQLP